MAFEPLTGIDLPDELDADDVPGWFASIFSGLTSHLVLKASSINDRNTRYATTPKGTIVKVVDTNQIWVKTHDINNTWDQPIFYRKVTTGYTSLHTNWTMTHFNLRQYGRVVTFEAAVTRKNSDVVFGAYNSSQPGNYADEILFVLPGGWGQPAEWIDWYGRIQAGVFAFGYIHGGTGQVVLTAGMPSTKVPIGQYLRIQATWISEVAF